MFFCIAYMLVMQNKKEAVWEMLDHRIRWLSIGLAALLLIISIICVIMFSPSRTQENQPNGTRLVMQPLREGGQ